MGFKVWEYHLSTNAVRRQYYPVWKVKIYSGTDNFQTKIRQIELHIYYIRRRERSPDKKKRKIFFPLFSLALALVLIKQKIITCV